MPEHVDFDNPTRKDLLRFRKKLHHALLFEPVVDLDFNRPAAKLGSLVQESQALMQRLKQIWDRYDSLLACLTRIVAILEPLEPVMEPILTIGFTPPRLAHFRDAVRMPGLSSEEWERRHALHEKRERLRTLAQQLSTQYRSSLHPADEIMRVQVAMSQINGGRFWLFLAQVTQRVSNGTSHVFEQHLIPENLKELLSDATDIAVEKADLPNPFPMIHIIRAMLAYFRRKEKRELKFAELDEIIDIKEFLATYFSWWTDGDGRSVVEDTVKDCEGIVEVYDQSVKLLQEQTRGFLSSMTEFDTLTREISPPSEKAS